MFYRPRHCGFTLVELIVAVSVLVILITVAVPSFQSTLDKKRLTGAAEQVYADIQATRFEAIKLNKQVSIAFRNLGTATSWCYGLDDDAATVCDCSTVAGAANCTVESVKRVMDNSDFKNVSITATGLASNNLCVEPRRGKFSSGT